jgi:hypothetical protein
LTHLSIWNSKAVTGMQHVFTHAASLVSLSLVEVVGRDILNVLRAHPAALPHLAEFKLMMLDRVETDTGEHDTHAICEFLRDRPALTRLDIDAPGASLRMVLDILPNLPKLTALGFDARASSSEEEVELLAKTIPRDLIALHIQHPWEGLCLDSYEIRPLVSPGSTHMPATVGRES